MTEAIPDRLARIIDYKRDEVAALKASHLLSSIEAAARAAPQVRDFAGAMLAIARDNGNALICEMKRKSPSAGDINTASSPVDMARSYERGGAACLSVLTDRPSFGGSLDDLQEVRASVAIPVLRKDFLVDPLQVLEARAYGADCILIILAAVDDALAKDLHDAADTLGMSVLLEAHDEAELERALALPSPLVGVNNRSLRTFTTDLGVTERLSRLVPADRLLIAESGIAGPDDVRRLRRSGARGFLIGETLMRAGDPQTLVQNLRNAGVSPR